MQRDQSTSTKTAKQLLDQSAIDLSDRHHLRLEQMTTNAVAHFSNKRRRYFRQLSIPVAMAGSVLFALWLWWPLRQPAGVQNDPSMAKVSPSDVVVPEWVMDTSVPMSLLNHMAFYDWLAKQEDKQNHG